jgi:hypothetical protein
MGFCVLAASLSGCAFGDRHVALNYPPPASESSPAPRLAPTLARGTTIIISRFSDERGNTPVGEVRNGWGMHTADVLTETDVGTWVMRALAHDLAAAGYTVKWASPATAAERIQMSGQVLTAYCRAMMTYEGEVSFMVQLTVDGKPVINRRITGRGGAGMNWAASSEGYGESLSIALRSAIADLVAQIQPTLGRLPPPPPPPAPPVQDIAPPNELATPKS